MDINGYHDARRELAKNEWEEKEKGRDSAVKG